MEEFHENLKIDGEEEVKNGDDELFYEKIEAPKFVDLNAPDHYNPGDDRYWFCLRVGCDQKHEEEMDSEAIYKNFVLRVMAERSPNIRLRKALYRKDSSANVKCPQTVPAKTSKPRVSRLALISSMTKRMVDSKVKVIPLSRKNATPNVKAKQSSVVTSKALTTPQNEKRPSNSAAFRSVRNPKVTTIAVPNNKVVAKKLFHSPKKSVTTKNALELNANVKKLCTGIKKLEITGGKYALVCNKQLPSNASRKQLRGREIKSRVYDALLSQKCKGQGSKSAKYSTKMNETNSQLYQGPVPHGAGNDFSDMEIEDKSRNGELGVCSNTENDEGTAHKTNVKIEISLAENRVEALSDASRNSLSNSEDRSLGENNFPELQVSSEEGSKSNESICQEGNMNSRLNKGTKETMNRQDRKHKLVLNDKENDDKAMESDDKENSSASHENRDLDCNTGHLEIKEFGKHENVKVTQKIAREMSKPSKESSTTAVPDSQGLKYGKPKPTNPKPFRLRTDERGILKEAQLEKKMHPAPPKEITLISRLHGGNSCKKHHNASLRSDKCFEQTPNTTKECCEKERNTTPRERKQNQNYSLKNSKERVRRKLSEAPQRQTVSSQQKLVSPLQKYSRDRTTENSRNGLKRTKSPFLRKLARHQEASSSEKEIASVMAPGQLCVIKEDSPTILPGVAVKPSKCSSSPETKFSASAVSRPSLRGKRFTTIPKEPNFHTIHTPKSCTRRVA